MRQRLSLVVSCVIAATLSAGAMAAAQVPSVLSDAGTAIEPQALDSALEAVHVQTGLQIVFVSSLTEGRASPGSPPGLSAEQTLTRVLEGTGLTFEWLDGKTVQVRAASAVNGAGQEERPEGHGTSHLTRTLAQSSGEERVEGATQTGVAAAPDESSLQEIVVTAARREQNAQDFVGGLQVFGGDELDRGGANGFEDYLLSVPGASLRDQGNGSVRISLRGMSNVGGSDFGALSTVSTVGLYLNEVPIQGTSMLPNLELYDLNRVEVLKGPQGTLYGEGAMGGAVRMMLNSPDPSRFRSTADATASGTQNGGLNYRVRGMLNAPLGATTAVRLVGSYRSDDGFIDNLATGEHDTNSRSGYSVRGLLSSQFTDQLSLELLALHDVSNADGFPQTDKNAGDLVVANPEGEYADVDTSIYGVTLQYAFGGANLTSVTSYSESSQSKQAFQFYPLAPTYPSSIGPTLARAVTDLDSFAQELRLVSTGDNRLDWVVGAFYRDKEQKNVANSNFTSENFALVNTLLAAASAPLLTQLTAGHEQSIDKYEQIAAYAELGFELIPRLDLTLGARWFDEDAHTFYSFVGSDLLAPLSLPAGLNLRGNDSGVVPKVGLSYKTASDKLLYVLASQGFRSSGPNVIHAFFPSLGKDFVGSDSLWNYEAGVRTGWLNNRLIANANVFFVDWSKIQGSQTKFEPSLGAELGFQGNAGDAEIKGAELEFRARITDRFHVGSAIGYTHAELTRSNSTALVGAELPNVPAWTGSAYFEQRFPFALGDGVLRFDAQYVDSQTTRFITATDEGGPLGSYFLGKLRLGFTSENGSWGLDLFVDNIWDERAELGRDLAFSGNTSLTGRVSVMQPRTTGVMVRVAL